MFFRSLLFVCSLHHGSTVQLRDPEPVSSTTKDHLDKICTDGALPKNEGTNYFWANKNGDHRMTGASRFVAPSKLTHGPSWSYRFKEGIGNSFHPCIDDQKHVYIASRNGPVHKFNSKGKHMWSKNVRNVVGACALMDGAIYLGLSTGYVTALNMTNGEQIWSKKYAQAAPSDSWSLAAHSGVIITIGSDHSGLDTGKHGDGGGNIIFALDSSDGTILWNRTVGKVYNFIASFADHPPSIISSDQHGHATRLRLCNGELVWKSQKTAPLPREAESVEVGTSGGSISPGNGLVYVSSNLHVGPTMKPVAENVFKPGEIMGVITAYNETTGGLVWLRTFDLPTSNDPAFGRLSKGHHSSLIVGLGDNPSHPDPLTEEDGIWPDGSIVMFRSQVVALDPMTGDLTGWEFTPPDWMHTGGAGDTQKKDCFQDAVSNAAIGGDGSVYFGHMNGKIYAIKDTNGDGHIDEDEVSSWDGHRIDQGSPGIASGMLVYSPCDGIHVFNREE